MDTASNRECCGPGRRALAGRSYFLAEYRTNDNPEREWCWRRTRAMVQRAPDGTPLMMIGVSMDITEHKRLEEALREADRRKDNYVAMLAHELRNPLGPIRNAVHLLKAEGSASAQAAFSQVIDQQSRHGRAPRRPLNVSRVPRHPGAPAGTGGLRTVIASALGPRQPSRRGPGQCGL
jgi:PAS domain-containing protein